MCCEEQAILKSMQDEGGTLLSGKETGRVPLGDFAHVR